MTVKTHFLIANPWIWWWLLISSILVSFDCLYIFSVTYRLNKYVPTVVYSLWSWYGSSDSQYDASGKGIESSNGWIETQSLFNIFEVIAQLVFLFGGMGKNESLILLMLVSTATLWKTLIYMR